MALAGRHAVPWLKNLVVSLPRRRPGFDPRQIWFLSKHTGSPCQYHFALFLIYTLLFPEGKRPQPTNHHTKRCCFGYREASDTQVLWLYGTWRYRGKCTALGLLIPDVSKERKGSLTLRGSTGSKRRKQITLVLSGNTTRDPHLILTL